MKHILRFDHITKVVGKGTDIVEKGYKFYEKNLKNTNGRFLFMDEPFQNIDACFFDSDLPIEIVLYDYIKNISNIKMEGHNIICGVEKSELQNVSNLFYDIGFVQFEGAQKWNITGPLNKNRDIYLSLKIDDKVDIMPINWGGYNCPCFIVKSVDRFFWEMGGHDGVILSEVNDLTINKQNLRVGFLGMKGFQLVFEFISPIRKNA